jgi:hypothetical protein
MKTGVTGTVEGIGPDFPQMEPADQLDAPNRRLPEKLRKCFSQQIKRFNGFRDPATWRPRASPAVILDN